MDIKSYDKGQTVKTVTVADAYGCPNLAIVEFAMNHTGETFDSLFGYRVDWLDDFSGPDTETVAVVTLYTD